MHSTIWNDLIFFFFFWFVSLFCSCYFYYFFFKSDVQCIDNVHFNDFVHSSISDASSVTHPHSVRNDPRLFNDDIDIRFSRTLNSCKVSPLEP